MDKATTQNIGAINLEGDTPSSKASKKSRKQVLQKNREFSNRMLFPTLNQQMSKHESTNTSIEKQMKEQSNKKLTNYGNLMCNTDLPITTPASKRSFKNS